jgi:hypothetical protein
MNEKGILENLYRKLGCNSQKPGTKAFMSLGEFKQLCQSGGMFEDSFAEKEGNLSFNLSMQT